jgi:hypothetical protein
VFHVERPIRSLHRSSHLVIDELAHCSGKRSEKREILKRTA